MIAQIKKNGTHSVVIVDPNRNVVGWNRHGEKHKAWQFTDETANIFTNIPGKNWFVFDGELIHNKTTSIKNQHYLYDILVCESIGLTGTPYNYRYQLLIDILMPSIHNTSKNEIQYWRIDEYTAIARNYSKNFEKLFNSLIAPEDEGIICRKPNGIYNGPNAETWMQKFRRKNLTKLY
jgi:hypothetical protein